VLVVRTDLFGASQLVVGSQSVGDSQEDGLMRFVEGVDIGPLGGPFDGFGLGSSLSYFFFEGFEVGSVSLGEDAEGALRDFGGGGEGESGEKLAEHINIELNIFFNSEEKVK
jgi:hypothetical protein